MSGVRLDTRVHIITGASTAVQNVQKCIELCGLKSDQIMLQPLASGQAVLTEDEKDLGVCVIDIGGGTTDIAVYMNGAIRHTSVIPAGGNLITKDLSKSLRTPLDAAEYIKIHYGVASCDTEGLGEMIEVPGVGVRTSRQVSSKVLAAIISARIQEIFGVVLGELQKSGFPKEVLNAGIVLTGGVSMMTGIVEFAEKSSICLYAPVRPKKWAVCPTVSAHRAFLPLSGCFMQHASWKETCRNRKTVQCKREKGAAVCWQD